MERFLALFGLISLKQHKSILRNVIADFDSYYRDELAKIPVRGARGRFVKKVKP